MKHTSFAARARLTACAVVALLITAAAPVSAANKEHQQLMADLRMMQEQTQLLQNQLGSVIDALKVVSTRLDQQTEINRKSFADQKLVIDNLTNDARVIREKLDDNNVRIGSLTQEVDALRQQLQRANARPTAAIEPDTPASGSTPAGGSSAPGGAAAGPGVTGSPQKLLDAAYTDYTAGQYDLAIFGYEAYIKSFPKSDMADDAQVYICAAYLNAKKDDKAAEACDLAIRTYPGANAIPEAYYRKGLALSNLKDAAGARATWEELLRKFPESSFAPLARQGLDKLRRPD